MLHLATDSKEFTYLNYLSVMSAQRFNEVTMWTKQEPIDNKYWELVKKLKTVTFKPIDPITGLTLAREDYTGRLDIIYIANMHEDMVDEAMIDHTGMYMEDGEFETKDMCLVRVFRPEVVTLEYVKDSHDTLAELIRTILLERVWNV